MKVNAAGLELIKSFEQCRLRAYKPTPDDVWTCGWGSTQGVTEDTVWTQEEADAALERDLEEAEACVTRAVTAFLHENENAALVSLCFNIGCKAFTDSTLVRLLNEGDFDAAQAQFKRWNKQAGKELAGLTRRRSAEETLFATT